MIHEIHPHHYKWAHNLDKRVGAPPGIVIHNTGSPPDTTVDEIHQWHLANGWAGIGYHAVIYPTGEIIRGRPIWADGAHCLDHNNWLGIVFCGNWDIQKTMPTKQLDAGKWLVHRWENVFHISRQHVKRHKDMPNNSTDCPGTHFPFNQIVIG
jgi:N-acetylmuramoyl-L-alanine amidase